jgi:predicted phosphodiesterase
MSSAATKTTQQMADWAHALNKDNTENNMKYALAILALCASGSSCYFPPQNARAVAVEPTEQRIRTQSDTFKVAFFGDSGNGAGFQQVLDLVKRQQAEMVFHLGDFAYDESNQAAPDIWQKRIDRSLGERFPYFLISGNHDLSQWPKYQKFFADHLKEHSPAICQGQQGPQDLGIKSTCSYRDIFAVLSGIGVVGSNHEAYLEESLRKNAAMPWKLCLWHKNQRDMQGGDKPDEVGWRAYQICQEHGAMIISGHEHSYARTRTLTALGDSAAAHGAAGPFHEIQLAPGKTFVACSGLGGASRRPWNCALHGKQRWWASVFATNYTLINGKQSEGGKCEQIAIDSNQDAEFGVLFIEFNYQGNPMEARGRFITTKDRVVDQFIVTRPF